MRRWTWRWRRSPLRRPWDRRDAWLGLLSALALLLGAPAAGAVAGSVAYESAAAARHEQVRTYHAVTGKLLEDTSGTATRAMTGNKRVPARAKWRTDEGRSRTGTVFTRAGRHEGDRVRVWLSAEGRPVPPPATRQEALDSGVATGLAAGAFTAVLVAGAWWWLRGRLDDARLAAWEREWDVVGPRWTHYREH
ncbi:hypothetical protein [Streptomyces sp. NPDC048172]|uniref:Rv1733c family protein n=1 Tax=Streptomyces sp. NPDC048172 TaxID=3365505 RepID=UPI00371C697B